MTATVSVDSVNNRENKIKNNYIRNMFR